MFLIITKMIDFKISRNKGMTRKYMEKLGLFHWVDCCFNICHSTIIRAMTWILKLVQSTPLEPSCHLVKLFDWQNDLDNLSSLYTLSLSILHIFHLQPGPTSLSWHAFSSVLTHSFFFLPFCSLLSSASVFPPHFHAWAENSTEFRAPIRKAAAWSQCSTLMPISQC